MPYSRSGKNKKKQLLLTSIIIISTLSLLLAGCENQNDKEGFSPEISSDNTKEDDTDLIQESSSESAKTSETIYASSENNPESQNVWF